jgi:hypothetical protein
MNTEAIEAARRLADWAHRWRVWAETEGTEIHARFAATEAEAIRAEVNRYLAAVGD